MSSTPIIPNDGAPLGGFRVCFLDPQKLQGKLETEAMGNYIFIESLDMRDYKTDGKRKGVMNMNKSVSLIAVLSILTFSLMVAPLYASESISKGWDRSYQTSEIIGSQVMNHQGEYLGRVQDLVFDPDGHVIFAIIGYWQWNWRIIGRDSVAVPFNELTYDRSGKHLVVMVDISWEKFQSAPKFAKAELTDRQRAEEVYKYFGQQPYWTERGSAGMDSHTMEKPVKGHMAK